MLVKGGSPVLVKPATAFNFENPQLDLDELEELLFDQMKMYGERAFAAQQIGVPITAMLFPIDVGSEKVTLMINPRIISISGVRSTLPEGMSNYPGLIVKVTRFSTVRVRFQTKDGSTLTRVFDSPLGNLFQQMMDLFNGIVFFERANMFVKSRAQNKWKSISRKINQLEKELVNEGRISNNNQGTIRKA